MWGRGCRLLEGFISFCLHFSSLSVSYVRLSLLPVRRFPHEFFSLEIFTYIIPPSLSVHLSTLYLACLLYHRICWICKKCVNSNDFIWLGKFYSFFFIWVFEPQTRLNTWIAEKSILLGLALLEYTFVFHRGEIANLAETRGLKSLQQWVMILINRQLQPKGVVFERISCVYHTLWPNLTLFSPYKSLLYCCRPTLSPCGAIRLAECLYEGERQPFIFSLCSDLFFELSKCLSLSHSGWLP